MISKLRYLVVGTLINMVLGVTWTVHAAPGANCTWSGDTANNWIDGTNWDCLAVPGSGDDVVVPSFDAWGSPSVPAVVAPLTVTPSPLIASLTLLVKLNVNANLGINPDATVNAEDNLLAVDGVVTNAGTIYMSKVVQTISGTTDFQILDSAGETPHYHGLSLTPSIDLGIVSPSIFGNQICGSTGNLNAAQTVQGCYGISPGSAGTAQATFYFDVGERNSAIDFLPYQWDEWISGWVIAGSTKTSNISIVPYYAGPDTVSLSSAGASKFALKDNARTDVSLATFDAHEVAAPTNPGIFLGMVFIGLAGISIWRRLV